MRKILEWFKDLIKLSGHEKVIDDLKIIPDPPLGTWSSEWDILSNNRVRTTHSFSGQQLDLLVSPFTGGYNVEWFLTRLMFDYNKTLGQGFYTTKSLTGIGWKLREDIREDGAVIPDEIYMDLDTLYGSSIVEEVLRE